jgi:lysozyme family protein
VETLALYAEARRRHYRSLATFWRFGKGWLTRVDRTLAAARAIAPTLSSPSPAQQQEQPTMPDTTQPDTTPSAPDTKWWGQSMTIWGVIITTLSTVLPAFGPLLGLDITAELIRQLGDQIVVIVQAVGGLIGTILTIWGRARATTTLERKQITMNM